MYSSVMLGMWGRLDARPIQIYDHTMAISIRFYIDPATNEPHIYNHNVHENEVEDVLGSPGEDRPGRDGSRIVIGKTHGGRYLRVIYVPDPEAGSVFVITAYELIGRPLAAYRRRRKSKRGR
ncbi:MAG: DUF4258 domain-containing protein [Gammaproteobacteria bacterium]